jgi:uncharacterized protein YkwD
VPCAGTHSRAVAVAPRRRGRALLGAFVLAVVGLGVVPAARAAADCADADALPSVLGTERATAAIACLTNAHRQALGLPALALDGGLTRAAQGHAEDMAARGYYEHTAPEGTAFSERLTAAGVDWSSAGENIAKQTSTPREVVQAWNASPAHEANIASATFTIAGYGLAPADDGALWVQEFARPAGPSAEPPQVPAAPTGTGPASSGAARPGNGTNGTDDDQDLADAARALAARTSASRAGRTLRLRVAVPGGRSPRARLTVRVSQRGRTVRTLSSTRTAGRSYRLRLRLPRPVAGRAVITIGTTRITASFG